MDKVSLVSHPSSLLEFGGMRFSEPIAVIAGGPTCIGAPIRVGALMAVICVAPTGAALCASRCIVLGTNDTIRSPYSSSARHLTGEASILCRCQVTGALNLAMPTIC